MWRGRTNRLQRRRGVHPTLIGPILADGGRVAPGSPDSDTHTASGIQFDD
jgi:hypothetical protein